MSVWNPFRKAKKAGQRVLDRMDQVEREARTGDIDAEARRLAFQSSETELEGGDDGFIGVRGESASNVVKNLTVNQFRKRLADHGLEGSLLKLNLLTDALATALASDD